MRRFCIIGFIGWAINSNPWQFVPKTRPKPKILKPQPQNPNRKIMIQNSKDEFVWDESSDSHKLTNGNRPRHFLLRLTGHLTHTYWQSVWMHEAGICNVIHSRPRPTRELLLLLLLLALPRVRISQQLLSIVLVVTRSKLDTDHGKALHTCTC